MIPQIEREEAKDSKDGGEEWQIRIDEFVSRGIRESDIQSPLDLYASSSSSPSPSSFFSASSFSSARFLQLRPLFHDGYSTHSRMIGTSIPLSISLFHLGLYSLSLLRQITISSLNIFLPTHLEFIEISQNLQ